MRHPDPITTERARAIRKNERKKKWKNRWKKLMLRCGSQVTTQEVKLEEKKQCNLGNDSYDSSVSETAHYAEVSLPDPVLSYPQYISHQYAYYPSWFQCPLDNQITAIPRAPVVGFYSAYASLPSFEHQDGVTFTTVSEQPAQQNFNRYSF